MLSYIEIDRGPGSKWQCHISATSTRLARSSLSRRRLRRRTTTAMRRRVRMLRTTAHQLHPVLCRSLTDTHNPNRSLCVDSERPPRVPIDQIRFRDSIARSNGPPPRGISPAIALSIENARRRLIQSPPTHPSIPTGSHGVARRRQWRPRRRRRYQEPPVAAAIISTHPVPSRRFASGCREGIRAGQ